jgi:hypothetical protein
MSKVNDSKQNGLKIQNLSGETRREKPSNQRILTSWEPDPTPKTRGQVKFSPGC